MKKLFTITDFSILFLLILCFNTRAFSQWESISSGTTDNLWGVHSVGENKAWACGDGIILDTEDSGVTWNSKTFSGKRLNDIFVTSGGLFGVAVGKDLPGTTGRVYYTTNASGGGWIAAERSNGTILTGKPWHAVSIAEDDDHGIIVGQEGQIAFTDVVAGGIWYERTSPAGTAGAIKDVTFYDGLKAIAVGYSSPSVGFIIKTTDGGSTWQSVETTLPWALNSVSFKDTKNGIAVGNEGIIYETFDGGDTWYVKDTPGYYIYNNLESVDFRSSNSAYIVGAFGTTVSTRNGGILWSEDPVTYPDSFFKSIYFSSQDSGYIVGLGGLILKYKNDSFINVYNEYTEYNVIDNKVSKQKKLDMWDLKIAADGSQSTIFKYHTLVPDGVTFRVKSDDPNYDNVSLVGEFSHTVDGDSIVARYQHPTYFNSTEKSKKLNIEVYNSNLDGGTVIYNFAINIVKPSVLMVHGIWSNGIDAFGSMKQSLISSGQYDSGQLLLANYQSDTHNSENVKEYIRDKRKLKKMALFNNISSRKIDVFGHSNGGVLSRYYIHSDQYENDINKLITFNTPHSGSQLPNLLLYTTVFDNPLTRQALRTFGMDPSKGIIEDLTVDGTFLNVYLNSQSVIPKAMGIPIHTITSTETASNMANDLKGKYPLLINYIKFQYPALGYVAPTVDIFLSDFVFLEPQHDVIVALESQIGGVSKTSSPFPNQMHSGSTGNGSIQAYALNLLNSDPNDSNTFSKDGFHPSRLTTKFPNDYSGKSTTTKSIQNETISISSPIEGALFNEGQLVNVVANGSTGINNIVSTMGGSSISLLNHVTESSNTTNFNFTIPNNAIGKLDITAAGFGDTGLESFDSTYIIVTTDALLESIEIQEDLVYVAEGQVKSIRIFGNYNDGVTRDITTLDGLTYQFANNFASSSNPGEISGVTKGEDILIVSKDGLSDTVPVIISDASEWYDITLAVNEEILDKNSSFLVYPNPTENKFIIKFPANHSKANVALFDFTGKQIVEKKISNTKNEIDISTLQGGIYLLKIKTGSSSTVVIKRIVKH